MARFRRFKRYGSRAYAGGKRFYGRARSVNNKFFGVNMGFIAGAAAGYFLPHNQLIDNGAVIAAVVPVKGLGIVKQASQGYVFAHAVKSLISGGIGNVPNTFSNNTVI